MNNEIIKEDALLNEDGSLKYHGWSRKLLLNYDRNAIKASKLRIKEWDYYLIYNQKFAIALTIDDNSYMGLTSVSLLDFENKKEKTVSLIKFFTNGKTNLPSTSKIGNVEVNNKKIKISFKNNGRKRYLSLWMRKFYQNNDLSIEAVLTDEPDESMVIATPYKEDKKAFYYNQKIMGLKARGFILYENRKIEFDESNTRAILDWGRGVWTYKNTWYWSCAAFEENGHEIGFNLGYGFGDTTAASENVFIYDGIVHKLDRVTFNIPQKNNKDDFMSEWTFTSNDGRMFLTFTPILDRFADSNVLIIRSLQHQVFGIFNGYFILDNGKKIEIKNHISFAEKVTNKW